MNIIENIFKKINNKECSANITSSDNDKLHEKKYDMIFSIGSSCHCAMHLDKIGLRKKSYPFDWSGGADPKICGRGGCRKKIELIVNDFQDWFRLEDFKIIAESTGPHHYAMNTKTGLAYYHHFPIEKTIAESFDDIYNKYNKRAKRFIDELNRAKRSLWVYTQDTWDQFSDKIEYYADNEIIMWQNTLKNKFPNNVIDFLFFEHDPEIKERGEINVIHVNDHITRIRSNHKFQVSEEAFSPILGIKEVLSTYSLTDMFE